LQSFVSYQETEAWTWEHLALTRARVLAGEPTLGAEVETFRRALLVRKGKGPAVRADVAAMRARLQGAKPPVGPWDAKNGPGRIMDIELAAQTVALIAGSPARGVERQIAAGTGTILPETDAQALAKAYRLEWQLHAATRLLTEGVLAMESLGDGARAFLARETGVAGPDDLARALAEVAGAAEAAVVRLIGETEAEGEASDGPERG
jgi:[glutamine synthetase] adenylyltransferase / [glutamine synthetase]-adenylyl-L-tyrosine phosphorylase